MTFTGEGIYFDMPEDEYHADPVPEGSLSFSSSKTLRSCPAKFAYGRTHREPSKDTFDFGNGAHALVLGTGWPITVIDFDDWRTKAAQEAKKEAHAAGQTPLLRGDYERVQAMAAAIEAHPLAMRLLDPNHGTAEVSLFREEEGIWLRSRMDWFPHAAEQVVCVDYKTTVSADPKDISKSVLNYGYHAQSAWYTDMITALGHAEQVNFGFIFQEKTAPYVVTVVELEPEAVDAGRRLNREALDIYRACTDADVWPAYSDSIVRVGLPRWAA